MAQYDVVSSTERRAGKLPRLPLRWDASTAVAVIVLGAALTVAALRTSLKGGAIQP